MIRRFKKFTNLSSEEKKLFFEAYVILGMMRTAILTISFKRLTRSLDHKKEMSEPETLNDEQMKVAIDIGKSITQASGHTFWESACLVQALTAQKMLNKRGIAGVFYLGAKKDEENQPNISAHAWIQCGNKVITGDSGYEEFTILSAFTWSSENV